MTPQEAADALNGNEYGSEGGSQIASKDFFQAMKDSNLIAVFGGSDDNMEFRGTVNDEVGCYGGGEAYLDQMGLLQSECEHETCPYFDKLKENASMIQAIWDDGGFSWRYETEIPHAKFIIKEDGENYCEGIVFCLGDVKP